MGFADERRKIVRDRTTGENKNTTETEEKISQYQGGTGSSFRTERINKYNQRHKIDARIRTDAWNGSGMKDATDFVHRYAENKDVEESDEDIQKSVEAKRPTYPTIKEMANTAREKRNTERKKYEAQKVLDSKGVTEHGIFKDGLTHFTPYEDIRKRADFQTGAYQGAKDNRNPIGTGNTMKGFWSNAADGMMNPFRIAAQTVKQSNGLYQSQLPVHDR